MSSVAASPEPTSPSSSRSVEQSPARVWRLQYGPCWCRGVPDDSGSFDFVRLTTSESDLGVLASNILIVSDRVIDGSQAVFQQVHDRVPDPKLVVSTSACPAASRFWDELPLDWTSVDEILPVDLHVDECVTGQPEALMAEVLRHVLSSRVAGENRPQLAATHRD